MPSYISHTTILTDKMVLSLNWRHSHNNRFRYIQIQTHTYAYAHPYNIMNYYILIRGAYKLPIHIWMLYRYIEGTMYLYAGMYSGLSVENESIYELKLNFLLPISVFWRAILKITPVILVKAPGRCFNLRFNRLAFYYTATTYAVIFSIFHLYYLPTVN